MLKVLIGKVVDGRDLTRTEAARAMNLIMDGEAEGSQIAALAVALRMKGESVDEIVGCTRAMRRRAETIVAGPSVRRRLVDTCGTGGDALGTLNVSTLAAIVAAGAGLPVAKHGNRSVTSRCGSADLLEALGVPIDLGPGDVEACLEETGFSFLFAPRFHPALRHAAAARRAIGLRTFFNLLGPLCNPAGTRRQLMGVYDRERLRTMAEVLLSLGAVHAMVVHGGDGMDELTVTGESAVAEVRDGRIRARTLRPEDVGLKRWSPRSLKGGGPGVNAARAREVLEGARGASRDITLFNAGAALYVGGVAPRLKEAVAMAARSIDSGAALDKLEQFRVFCRMRASHRERSA